MSTLQRPISEENILRSVAYYLVSFWNYLTRPVGTVIEPELRRRMRLLAAMVIVLLPVGLLSFIFAHLQSSPDQSIIKSEALPSIAVGSLMLVAGYFLGRMPSYYVLGAAVVLAAFSLSSLTAAASDPKNIDNLLVFLAMDILLGSLLLDLRGTYIVAGANVVAVLLLPSFTSEISTQDVTNALLYIILMSVVILLAASIRKNDLQQIEDQSEELRNTLKKVEEANRLKSQFLATMSHELRTPLNAIIGFAEVMMMGLTGALPEESQRTTARIHENSRRLLHLIDDLLDISKIEAGRLEVVNSLFSPAELVSDIERTLQSQASAKSLELKTEVDLKLPKELLGDVQRLEQILLNLATNAIKFTEQGSITLSAQKLDPTQWVIKVTDTGIVIPPHMQETIFDKFRQVDGTSSRVYKGAGLGLSIARELTMLMDGTIKVDSKVGGGSTFTITLPLLLPVGKNRHE